MKMLGNKIPWFKPTAIQQRNENLEILNNAQYVRIKALEDEQKELENKIQNRDNCIAIMLKENIDYANNIIILRETILGIKEKCLKSKTKLAKEILEQIKID